MYISKRLKELRTVSGFSQEKLAELLDVSSVITSRAVSNGTNIMSVLVKLTNKRDCKV